MDFTFLLNILHYFIIITKDNENNELNDEDLIDFNEDLISFVEEATPAREEEPEQEEVDYTMTKDSSESRDSLNHFSGIRNLFDKSQDETLSNTDLDANDSLSSSSSETTEKDTESSESDSCVEP